MTTSIPPNSVKRVLIVEDDELITSLMKDVLEAEGFMVDLSTTDSRLSK